MSKPYAKAIEVLERALHSARRESEWYPEHLQSQLPWNRDAEDIREAIQLLKCTQIALKK